MLATTALVVVAADALTKALVVARLGNRLHQTRLLGGLVVLHESRNPGAAFGIAGGATIVFSVVALIVVAVILRSARRLRSLPWAVCLGLLLGGALGNLADRLFREPGVLRGRVVDFIDLQWHARSVWPSFNVADASIVVGGLVALVLTARRVDLGGADPAAPASDTEP